MSEIATVKVELSDEQMDVLLRDIGDLIGKVDALEQRISDVNDAALYDRSQLEERIDALESRIEAVEWLTDIVKAHSKLFDAILRKLNYKGGSE